MLSQNLILPIFVIFGIVFEQSPSLHSSLALTVPCYEICRRGRFGRHFANSSLSEHDYGISGFDRHIIFPFLSEHDYGIKGLPGLVFSFLESNRAHLCNLWNRVQTDTFAALFISSNSIAFGILLRVRICQGFCLFFYCLNTITGLKDYRD